MSGIPKIILAAFSFGTRFRGPMKPDSPRVFSHALALQPLIGLFIGFAATLLPFFLAAGFRDLQGLVLFASGIYLFLLEWLTRFDNLHAFDAACRALAGAEAPPEERLGRLGQPGSSPCTALLVGLKIMLMYLIFLRTALFGDLLLLLFILVSVPFLGRIAMLFAYPSSPGKLPGSIGIAVKVFWVFAALILMAFTLGLLRTCGGDFFSFRSMKLTMSGFGFAQNGSGGVPPLIAIISLGVQDTFSFFLSGYLAVLYWNTEAQFKLGMRPAPCFAGAVCETAELGAMIVFLILTSDLIA